jgi:predicted HicB family RNase H-like nuclease
MTTESTKKGICFPLRLPLTMRAELQAQANNEGVSINQFIVMAVAEKITRIDVQQPVDGNRDPSEHHSE